MSSWTAVSCPPEGFFVTRAVRTILSFLQEWTALSVGSWAQDCQENMRGPRVERPVPRVLSGLCPCKAGPNNLLDLGRRETWVLRLCWAHPGPQPLDSLEWCSCLQGPALILSCSRGFVFPPQQCFLVSWPLLRKKITQHQSILRK